MTTWTAAIDKAADLLDISVNDVVRVLSFQIFSGVVMKTPVDLGHLRAAWNMSLNTEDYVTSAGQRGNNSLPADLGRWPIVYITNGLPYAAVVEYGLYPGIGPKTVSGENPTTGGGIFSKQAPVGMVEVTLAEVQAGMARMFQ